MPRELRVVMETAQTATLAPPPSHSCRPPTTTNTSVILLLAACGFLCGSFSGSLVPCIVARGAGSYTYTLSDGPLQRWRLLPWLFYFLWLQFDFFEKGRQLTLKVLLYFGFVFVFPVLIALFIKSPVTKLDFETKQFADFMLGRKSRSVALFIRDGILGNNNNMENRCEYPFIRLEDGTWVTIKDVLQFDQQNQDTFLSYSLCRLLARRYFKFVCAEEGDAEVHNFALTHLLSNYRRAFALVEVQLAFLHDHFYTDHPNKIGARGSQLLLYLGIGYIIGVSINILLGFSINHNYLSNIDPTTTAGFLMGYLLEVGPKFYPILLPKYWHPIRHMLKYYPIATPGKVHNTLSQGHEYYWRNKIGQYSLLADYDRPSLNKAASIDWFQQRLLSDTSPDFIKYYPTAEDDVSVPDSVRSLVTLTLQQYINGPPTNGTESLWRNRYHLVPTGCNLLWTCELECHTQTILTWHIATCYCNMMTMPMPQAQHEVAKALSKYCAYLVAFIPQFLPQHRLTSMAELQAVLESAKKKLPAQRLSVVQKCSKLQEIQLPMHQTNMDTFQKGIFLGRQLMKVGLLVRWKVMAEFWVETILYIAPSDDATAHIEHLAKGGEFVTHLWAMLCNAGILQRATEDSTLPVPQLLQQQQ